MKVRCSFRYETRHRLGHLKGISSSPFFILIILETRLLEMILLLIVTNFQILPTFEMSRGSLGWKYLSLVISLGGGQCVVSTSARDPASLFRGITSTFLLHVTEVIILIPLINEMQNLSE